MLPPVTVAAATDRVAEIRFTERHDAGREVERVGTSTPWTRIKQVHGATIVEVDVAGARFGDEGDGMVSGVLDAPLSVETADCAPVVLVGCGRLAVVHAGWRGLVAGVLERAVEAMDCEPARIEAHLGPTIRPEHYDFGAAELDSIVAHFGPAARATTRAGRPALDLPGAVQSSLARVGVTGVVDHGYDTADPRFFSHRLRADHGRHFTVAWLRAA